MMTEPSTEPWSTKQRINLAPDELWDLMWRPEPQRLWLGSGPPLLLEQNVRCVLSDQAGIWRSGYLHAVEAPTTVTLRMEPAPWWGETAATTVRVHIAREGESASLVEVEESGVPASRLAEVEQYWSRRLGLLRALSGDVNRRRGDVRQAMVVIHGIGEQLPGTTLAALADSGVLPTAKEGESVWVKPDPVSGSFELHRVAFKGSAEGNLPATDVYEFYWAHMIRDTTLGQVGAWMHRLLLRWHVPRPLRPLWLASWALVLLVAATALAALLGAVDLSRWLAGGTALVVVAGLVWRLVGRGLAVQTLGDAARYLLPLPDNVARRQQIREAGVDLIDRLHRSGRYDRIVILGHSLGSVIAYDIITYAWGRIHTRHLRPRMPSFAEIRDVERNIDIGEVAAAQHIQHAAWRRQRANTQPWLITDLVTVGSPLTYADLLMAATPGDFAKAKQERILPTCPPVAEREAKTGHLRVSYERPFRDVFGDGKRTFTQLHHAAPFAVTRWTNLYFETRWLGLAGDLIGGPVAGSFGHWVRDVPLASPAPRFTHTWYWRPAGTSAHLDALRDAIALRARSALVEQLREIPAYALVRSD